MKYKNVFWGLLLILIGGLIIGRNLDWFYFDWYSFVRLWPIIFILWGISVLPIRDGFKIGLLVIVLGGATWYVTQAPYSGGPRFWGYSFSFPEHHFGRDHFRGEQDFNIPYSDSIQTAELKLDAGAGKFYLKDTSSDLVYFHEMGRRDLFKYFLEEGRGHAKVNITENGPNVYFLGSDNKVVDLKLNSGPVWDINLNAGASKLDFDLSAFKVANFEIDGGASAFKVTLGNLYPETHLTLDAGISAVIIRVPKSSGCDLRLSSVLSNRNIEGFQKVGDQHYQSGNFDTSKNKIYLNINTPISSFKIERY